MRLIRSRPWDFIFTEIQAKIVSRKFHGFWAIGFGDSQKSLYFKFHKDSSNMFVNTSEGVWFFIYLIKLLKLVYIVETCSYGLKVSFHWFWSILRRTWYISYSLRKRKEMNCFCLRDQKFCTYVAMRKHTRKHGKKGKINRN